MPIISWFSAGVSSAVATKLVANKVDRIVYQHIDDQHEDTLRFIKECEDWFGKKVEIIQSPFKSVENVCRFKRFINGPSGAACTRILKRELRKQWEQDEYGGSRLTYVWGFDKDEKTRAARLLETMSGYGHIFPLLDNGFTKENAHWMIKNAGIARPKMYELGYPNNNCVGCVKGGKGYWNKIRVDFPEVFEKRAKMEREIGARCMSDGFLDELDPNTGREQKVILENCGVFCSKD